VFTCIREKTDLDHAGRRLAANGERMLRSSAAMARRFADLPDAWPTPAKLALRLAFTLRTSATGFRSRRCPPATPR